MYSIGNVDLFTVDLLLPFQGVWVGQVECAPEASFVVGDTVKMQLGTLDFVGTITRGSSNNDSAKFTIVGGKGGWRKVVTRRFYRDNDGIKLRQVLRDLASDCGETVELDASAAGEYLGDTWTRAECTASDCLQKLGKVWRVRPDGVTIVAPSIKVTASERLSIRSFNAATGIVMVDFPDDGMDELLPGVTVISDGFTFTARNVRLIVEESAVFARVST